MSLRGIFLDTLAATLAPRERISFPPEAPRVLVIRRNRMGDMICTLPLLYALRRGLPAAHLTVACDAPGWPIARACPAVNEVVLLRSGGNRLIAGLRHARALQGYDLVLAAKAGFDRHLAGLTRLTNAPRRIGYENKGPSDFYTDPIPIPANLWEIHQIEATLRLLAPLGLVASADPGADLRFDLPAPSLAFVETVLADAPFAGRAHVAVANLSSTAPVRFSDDDLVFALREIAEDSAWALALVGVPADQPRARRLALALGGNAVAVATPGPLDLAALLRRAALFLTPEGGAAHLAAVTRTRTLVLWSEGPFEKWHSRGPRQTFLRLDENGNRPVRERIGAALRGCLRDATGAN